MKVQEPHCKEVTCTGGKRTQLWPQKAWRPPRKLSDSPMNSSGLAARVNIWACRQALVLAWLHSFCLALTLAHTKHLLSAPRHHTAWKPAFLWGNPGSFPQSQLPREPPGTHSPPRWWHRALVPTHGGVQSQTFAKFNQVKDNLHCCCLAL